VVIPEAVYELGRPKSSVRKSERIEGAVAISQRRARQLQVQPTLLETKSGKPKSIFTPPIFVGSSRHGC